MFYGAANVLVNAYLPVFVRNHPDIRVEPIAVSSGASTSTSVITELAPPTQPGNQSEDVEKANHLAAHISSRGITFGYISALILQTSCLGIIYFLGVDNPISLKAPIFLTAIWWGIFLFPTVPFWLKARPGPPLLAASRHSGSKINQICLYIGFGWKQIWSTLKDIRRLREVRIYLISWFFLSDGVITMSSLAIIYAKTSLEFTPAGLALISVSALITNALGAWLWPSFLAAKLQLGAVSMMILLIWLMACVSSYALIGLIWPGIVDILGWGAMTNAWELYILAAIVGFVAGGINVYGRSIFSELIPSGKESTFFSVKSSALLD
jgi:MFS transporter, UMF1 family